MSEFDIIARYFQRPVRRAVLGGGDDCALLAPTPGMQMAISSDMLVEGRHFFADVSPQHLGHKALAVNLSDLAAAGAQPLAFTLALSLPRIDEAWLQGFSQGLYALAEAHGCELIGGDTTRGPLNLCITVFGEVPAGQALLRSGARAGDDLYVSGTLGDARLGLDAALGHGPLPPDLQAVCMARLEQPTPRVALGLALRGIATSALDLSDGLAGDLGHILQASQVGATVQADALRACLGARQHPWVQAGQLSAQRWLECTLSGGDDYELAFTAPASQRAAVQAAAQQAHTPVQRIGQIEAQPGLRVLEADGQPVTARFASFDHFAAPG